MMDTPFLSCRSRVFTALPVLGNPLDAPPQRRADHPLSKKEVPASTAEGAPRENPKDTAVLTLVGLRNANIGQSGQSGE